MAASKKLLITGGEGMLATDLARVAAAAGYEVTGVSHAQLNVTDAKLVREALESLKPDLVVNTPGIGVDTCESEPAAGYRVHTWAAQAVAQSCDRIGAVCVYISSCGLFSDEFKFNSEYDPVELKTQYARSKFLGEQATSQSCYKSFIIRPGWLFGGQATHARNFVYQRFLQAQNEPLLKSAADKFGSPTSTEDLAGKILEIVQTEHYGLYHVTSSGQASRLDYVRCIVEAFGLNTAVEPADSSAFSRAAPVPNCELLDNVNLRFLGLEPIGPWQEAIQKHVRYLKQQGV